MVSGPKAAHLVALETVRLNRPLSLDVIFTQGGKLSEEDRRAYKQIFGAKAIELYSSKEGGHMAISCPHNRLHVNAEAVLLEILDENGQPVAPGETGRIVITPFFSTAQPLIRYDHGDLATAGATCTCGLTLPAINEIVGRSIAIFRHPDGRAVVGLMPDAAREFLDCDAWQMAQTGPNEYEVRYVPRSPAPAPDEAAFVALFQARYFADSVVGFRRVSSIPAARAGKALEYVNEWYRPTS
jgi:phenylacetate-CoA ligase